MSFSRIISILFIIGLFQCGLSQVSNRQLYTKLVEIHAGCGVTKGCFGTPYTCINGEELDETNPCALMTTFRVDGQRYIFEAYGQSNGYIASGLSTDDLMTNDSVVACINDNGQAVVRKTYNMDKTFGNKFTTDPNLGLIESSISFDDGFIVCNFTRSPTVSIPEIELDINLNTTKYHIIMAKSNGFSETGLGQHAGTVSDRVVSAESFYIQNPNHDETTTNPPTEPTTNKAPSSNILNFFTVSTAILLIKIC